MIRELIIAPILGLQVAATIAFACGVYRYWPDDGAAWLTYVTPLFLGAHALWFGWPSITQAIKYHLQIIRNRRAHEPKAKTGDGGFATKKELDAAGHFDPNAGIPVGKFNGRIIFANFTHALCNAPAGTGKSISITIPALAHGYRIPGKKKGESTCASVVVADLKRELKAMTARLRREVHGQRVIILDPSDHLSGSYNPLDLVIDCLHGDGPRGRAVTFAGFIALCLEPEPVGDAKNKFFRAGARNLIVLVTLWLCLLHREHATLSEVCRIIRDPAALEALLLECKTSDVFGGELGIMARDALGQVEHLAEFRTGAALALMAFSEAGELGRVTARSTFRWSELKRIPTTVYICASLSESRVFGPYLKLLAESAMTEIEFSTGNIPVHFLFDEATNIAGGGGNGGGLDVASRMTALRSAGARIHLIYQERSEAKKVWGEHATHTIYGEVDLDQYFGFNDSSLAEDVSKRLGTVEVVKTNYHAGANPWDAYSVTSVTERRPLMTAYQLMFELPPTDQILFIRSRKAKLKPVLCQRLTYADVAEWIAMLDDNPVEGGKLRGPPTIRMSYSSGGVRVDKFKRTSPIITWTGIKRAARFLPPLWAAWAAAWLWLAHAAFVRSVSFLHSLEFT